MLERWFGPKIHHYLHLLGMMVLAFGLPFNKVLMSIGSIWGIANLLLEGKYKLFYSNIRNNRAFLFLLGFFFVHIVALIWTSNFEYAFHDLRIKLPLLVIPLALVAHPIVARKEIHLVLLTFLASLTLISGINGYNYFQLTEIQISNNFREISMFGSHIRFSLMISVGIVICVYFFYHFKKWRLLFGIIGIWFLVYTIFSQVLSGPLAIISVLFFALIYWIWPKKLLRYSFLSLLVISFVAGVFTIRNANQKEHFDFSKLDEYSVRGNLYFHDTINPSFENGKPVFIYISYDELKKDWNKYFSIPYDGFDKKNSPIKATLYRYMTALDLRKDSDGLKQLSKIDIENIENGIPSPNHLKGGFEGRYIALKYGLENQTDPNNSTILQRLEYWRTAGQIIAKNPILGVGTGDVQDAFNAQYEANHSELIEKNRLRAHNMFLTIQLSFGILGSLIFLFFLWSFLYRIRSLKNFFTFCIFGAIISSFLVEDTLETQTGVTLFSFFIGLILVQWDTIIQPISKERQ